MRVTCRVSHMKTQKRNEMKMKGVNIRSSDSEEHGPITLS
jgi:hypothetical protein